jgi:hypothetical protein
MHDTVTEDLRILFGTNFSEKIFSPLAKIFNIIIYIEIINNPYNVYMQTIDSLNGIVSNIFGKHWFSVPRERTTYFYYFILFLRQTAE